MAKNIAIVVGITDYIGDNAQLPACEFDAKAMESVLRSGGKFQEIIRIQSKDAQLLKSDLAGAIERFGHEEVDDLLFYFTGHGRVIDDNFHYILRDFDKSRPSQTTLSNNELDQMLKSLNPKIAVKIVDACYSAVQYLKAGEGLNDYLSRSSQGLFDKCYFMFSSERDQRSYASENVSDFTKTLIEGIVNCSSDSVRYKDLSDYLSDAFLDRPSQKPAFVIQSNLTEVFGTYDDAQKNSIKSMLVGGAQVEALPAVLEQQDQLLIESDERIPLSTLAQRLSDQFVSMEKAKQIVEDFQHQLATITLSPEVNDLYDIQRYFSDSYDIVPQTENLGKWLIDNKDGEYFASVISRTVNVEGVESSAENFVRKVYSSLIGPAIKTRTIIEGIETKLADMPFVTCYLTFKPRHPNLLQYGATITYFLSKRKLQLFFCFDHYIEESWNSFKKYRTLPWASKSFHLNTVKPHEIALPFTHAVSKWLEEETEARLSRMINDAP